MSGAPLKLENSIRDAISRIRFAPKSENLLISSWDSSLRLYDVGSSTLRLEAPSEAALLDCCLQDESVAFSAGSDGFIRRYSGVHDSIGNHGDISTCVGYSDVTWDPGDNEGYVTAWDAKSRKRLFELPRYPNSVASLSYNHNGQLLAIASSYTYQEANEIDLPLVFMHELGNDNVSSLSAGSSSSK